MNALKHDTTHCKTTHLRPAPSEECKRIDDERHHSVMHFLFIGLLSACHTLVAYCVQTTRHKVAQSSRDHSTRDLVFDAKQGTDN